MLQIITYLTILQRDGTVPWNDATIIMELIGNDNHINKKSAVQDMHSGNLMFLLFLFHSWLLFISVIFFFFHFSSNIFITKFMAVIASSTHTDIHLFGGSFVWLAHNIFIFACHCIDASAGQTHRTAAHFDRMQPRVYTYIVHSNHPWAHNSKSSEKWYLNHTLIKFEELELIIMIMIYTFFMHFVIVLLLLLQSFFLSCTHTTRWTSRIDVWRRKKQQRWKEKIKKKKWNAERRNAAKICDECVWRRHAVFT